MSRRVVAEISGKVGRATLSWGLLAPRPRGSARKRSSLSTAELVFCEGERHAHSIVITHPA